MWPYLIQAGIIPMISEKTISVSLEEFGLSQYEARAYVTLISKGTISASELAYYAELPRTKVYPILLKLEKKKLAIISKSKPIMCTAIAPEDAFDEIVQEQINRVNAMNSLVTNLKKINEESKKSRGSEEKRYFHLSPNAVVNRLQAMIEGAKSTIHIIADQWGLGLIAECKDQISSALRKKVEIKLIVPPNQIGSEAFRKLPNDVKIRISEITQNCFNFDETEIFLIDSNTGKGAVFSSADVLGSNQMKIFLQIWKMSFRTDCLSDMTKSEAQEIYKIIRLVNDNALGYILNTSLKKDKCDLLEFLETNGLNIKSRSLDEVIEIIDSTLQITCGGRVNFDAKNKNVLIESKVNSGHSLPWVTILENYLKINGFNPRMIYQNNLQKGEKIHIKILH